MKFRHVCFMAVMVSVFLASGTVLAVDPIDVSGTTWYLDTNLSLKASRAGTMKDKPVIILMFDDANGFVMTDVDELYTLEGEYVMDEKNVATFAFDPIPLELFTWEMAEEIAEEEMDEDDEVLLEILDVYNVEAEGEGKVKEGKTDFSFKYSIASFNLGKG